MYALSISLMEEREREHARRNRHAWNYPPERTRPSLPHRAMAAVPAALRLHQHMIWKPMTLEQAQGVLSHEPPAIGTIKGESGRYVEAWMVQWGASPARIKAVLELVRGYPL
jgi:hypothetical protein